MYLCIVKQSGMNQSFTYSISSSFPFFADIHTFSAKEKDSETGLSYFGSRYYSSDLSIWLSVDPMSDKYPSLSPYAYCANNPIKLVDPNGEEVGDYRDWNGKLLGTDGINDKNVYFTSDKASLKKIKMNEKKKLTTNLSNVKVDWETNTTEIAEIIDVYDRTERNGGDREEASSFLKKGDVPKKYPTGNEDGTIDIDPQGYLSIHSHKLNIYENNGEITYYTPFNISDDFDKKIFPNYQNNVVVGNSYNAYTNPRTGIEQVSRIPQAVIYNSQNKRIGFISIENLRNIKNTSMP